MHPAYEELIQKLVYAGDNADTERDRAVWYTAVEVVRGHAQVEAVQPPHRTRILCVAGDHVVHVARAANASRSPVCAHTACGEETPVLLFWVEGFPVGAAWVDAPRCQKCLDADKPPVDLRAVALEKWAHPLLTASATALPSSAVTGDALGPDAYVMDHWRITMDGKLLPLRDGVLIKMDPAKEQTESGLFIPQVAQERRERIERGTVLAVGPGRWTLVPDGPEGPHPFVRGPMDLLPGDVVLFNRYAGHEVEPDVRLVTANDVAALVERPIAAVDLGTGPDRAVVATVGEQGVQALGEHLR